MMFGHVKFQVVLGLAIALGSVQSFGETLTAKQAVNLVTASNPDILSLQHQVESADATARLAFAPSEPSIGITYNDLDTSLKTSNSQSNVYSITQGFAFPGKAFVNNAALKHQAKSIYYQLKSTELNVANTVKTAYYNLAVARQDLILNAETKETYERILAIAKRRYESGAISQVDLLNSEIALFSNSNDLADLETTEKATLAQLNILLKRDNDSPITIEPIRDLVKPLGSYNEAEQKMIGFRAEIKSANELSEAANSSYTLAKMAYLPDFEFTGGATDYNTPGSSPLATPTANNSRTYFVGLSMTIPLWGFFNERESVIAASHDKAAAEANLMSINYQSRTDLKATWENLQALSRKIKTYEDHLLTLSQQAFKLALINYSSGKIDYQALSDAADAQNQIKHDYNDLINSYLTAYSTYGQFIGEDL